jgi:hypothetical protein
MWKVMAMRSIFSQILPIFIPHFPCSPQANSSIGAAFGGKGGNGSIYRYFYYPRVYEKNPEMHPVSPEPSRSLNFAAIDLRPELHALWCRALAWSLSNFRGSFPRLSPCGAKDRKTGLVFDFPRGSFYLRRSGSFFNLFKFKAVPHEKTRTE